MTSAIETALTELSANLRRMEQRHRATGYKFDRLYGLIDAAREELAGLTERSEQEAGLLNQAVEMLHALANDERNRGNCSTSEGATASAYAVQRLATRWAA